MAGQWEEEQHLDDLIGRRRLGGSSLKLDVMQKVPELVENKRMSQGEKQKDTKEQKKMPGWSIEEMKERPNIAVEENTEEMKRWRSLNQSEMDLRLKNLAERWKRRSWTNTKSKKASKEPSKAEANHWKGEECEEVKIQN